MERIKQNIPAHGMLKAVAALHTTARPTIRVTHADGHGYTVEVQAQECHGPLIFARLVQPRGRKQAMFDGLVQLHFLPGSDGWRDKAAKHPSERPVLEPA